MDIQNILLQFSSLNEFHWGLVPLYDAWLALFHTRERHFNNVNGLLLFAPLKSIRGVLHEALMET